MGSSPQFVAEQTGTYYLRARSTITGCWSADCVGVPVTVLPLPAVPTNAQADPPQPCVGDTVRLSADADDHIIDWYQDGCGQTFVGTGSPLQVTVTDTITYYARSRDAATGCQSDECASVTVTTGPGVTFELQPQDQEICQGQLASFVVVAQGVAA